MTRLLARGGLLAATMVLMTVASSPVVAQSEDELEIFRIEVIVFAHRDTEPPPPWHVNAPPPSLDNAQSLIEDGDDVVPSTRSLLLVDPFIPFQPLPDDQRTLQYAWQRLQSSDVTVPLVEAAWDQYEAPFNDGIAVRVGGGQTLARERANAMLWSSEELEVREIDGTVTFSKGRFLHINVDLVYRVPINNAGPFSRLIEFADRSIAPTPWRSYRITERRQIRTNEVMYFDHPKFGALVKVTRPAEE